MNERTFLPTQRLQNLQILFRQRFSHQDSQQPTIIKEGSDSQPLLFHETAYKKATNLLIEKTSKNGDVVSYQPYKYTVEGKNGQHEVASRYTSVDINGKKAWFEILQDTPEIPVTEIYFMTSHPLDTILNNTQNSDTQKLANQINNPQPGNSLIRLVNFEEVPLVEGYERVTDPQELLIASQKIIDHLLLENQREGVNTELPKLEDLENFSQKSFRFEPMYEAKNGTVIGKGREIDAKVKEGEGEQVRKIFTYPVQTTEESGNIKQTYLISTEEINPDNQTKLAVIFGREDSICSCEKFGTHVLNHSCGHELLGSLQKQPLKDNFPVIIAWDPAADANGNGSVMHSLKAKNLTKLPQISDELKAFAPQYEYDVALADRRNFAPLAQTLAAASEFFDTSIVILQSTNPQKVTAMNHQLGRLEGTVYLVTDAHENRVVPESVRNTEKENDERPHKYNDRERRYSLLPN